MAAILLDEASAVANSRLAAIRLTALTLRWMETWRRNVGDYDSAMVLLAVVAITAGRLLRGDLGAELRDMAVPVPDATLARCSVASIAAATGLNRETARRKVAALIARGYLMKDDDGSIRFTRGYLQQPRVAETVRMQLDAFVRVANDLTRDGVLRLAG